MKIAVVTKDSRTFVCDYNDVTSVEQFVNALQDGRKWLVMGDIAVRVDEITTVMNPDAQGVTISR